MAIRKIREVGDDVLEKQCKKVDKMTLRNEDPHSGYVRYDV